MLDKIYQGQTGLAIRADAKESLASAQVVKLSVQYPDGSVSTWGASANGTVATHITDANSLTQSGVYYAQLYVETPSWSGLGDSFSFTVYKPFK